MININRRAFAFEDVFVWLALREEHARAQQELKDKQEREREEMREKQGIETDAEKDKEKVEDKYRGNE